MLIKKKAKHKEDKGHKNVEKKGHSHEEKGHREKQ